MLSRHTSSSSSVIFYDLTCSKYSWSSISYTTYKKIVTVNCSQSKKRNTIQTFPQTFTIAIGLNIHATARDKKMIENFKQFGISISYDRVLQLESLLTRNLCEQFKKDNIVCPSQLRKGIFTVGNIDNLDHNPSSATGQGSSHGLATRVQGLQAFAFCALTVFCKHFATGKHLCYCYCY